MILFSPSVSISFALLHRIMGGFIPTRSTTFARAMAWAVPCGNLCAALVMLSGATGWQMALCGAATAFLVWCGQLIPHARYQDWDAPFDWLGMAGVGAARHALMAVPVAFYFQSPLMWFLFSLAGGAGYTGCYAAAYRWFALLRVKWLAVPKSVPDPYPAPGLRDEYDARYSVALQAATDWAELFVGAWSATLYMGIFGGLTHG